MKKLIIVFIFFLVSCMPALSQNNLRLQDFGLSMKHRQIDTKKMTKKQSDTIVVCTINYEDQFPDICICSRTKKEITIYKSLGNGLFGFYKSIPLQKEPAKIESTLPDDYPFYMSPFYDLKVTYNDGSKQTIYNRKINSLNDQPEPRVPKWDFLNDARAFQYDFNYIKAWQSERNGQPEYAAPVGDIDNDGRNEIVYTFYPINDSVPTYSPTHITVFECVDQNRYIIDWDTLLQRGGSSAISHLIADFDRNGKKEFFAEAFDPGYDRGTYGLFECSGERKYRFWGIDDFLFLGPITDVVYYDTMKIIDTTKNPGVWLNFYPSGTGTNIYDRISPYKYSRKYQVPGGFGHYEFHTTPDDAVYFIKLYNQVLDIDVADIDNDGKEEILLGGYDATTNWIDYLDSTGVNYNYGYQVKTLTPGVPLSGGWLMTKDFDNDRQKEIISWGIGYATGSLGIVKHTGLPGENTFATMWWDTVGLEAQPNWGVDTATINQKFTILYPCIRHQGPIEFENISTFSRNGLYSFYRSSFNIFDSLGIVGPNYFDMDNDKKMEIIGTTITLPAPSKEYLTVYRMDNLTYKGNENISDIETFMLYQNYPNPFNPETVIKYNIPAQSEVRLKIYNVLGKEITTLVNQKQNEGNYEVKFNAKDYSAGIYFYTLELNGQIADTKKMILIK